MQSGKRLRQFLPQPGDITRGGAVLGLESDEDFAVAVADGAIIDVGPSRKRRRQSHIIEDDVPFVLRYDLADHVLDPAEDPLGLLDPRARRRPHVQAELACIDGREEVLAQARTH